MDGYELASRRPRHEARPDSECRLIIQLVDSDETFLATLADLSRQGLKAITDRELPTGECVRIEADLPHGPLLIAATATVRWSRVQDDGQWTAGLQFERELAWEILGELFLSGVLCRSDTSPRQMPDTV